MRHTLALLLSLCAFSQPALADGPAVVELYTSQGCSSCPPADAMLHDLAGREDVIALALHVDYWDYIGWADSFADPAFTRRQNQYAREAGIASVYTPQIVIGGQDHVVGTKPMEVAELIQRHNDADTGARITLSRTGDRLRITGTAPDGVAQGALVQLVHFSPEQTVDIHRGENAGRTITYVNIVTQWRVVGEWTGSEPLEMTVELTRSEPLAVIVQRPGPGAVLASAQLR